MQEKELRELIIGGTYRHYKRGRLYKVLAEIKAHKNISDGEILDINPFQEVCAVERIKEGSSAVIYGHSNNCRYISTKTRFLEVLGNGTTMFYRFEEVVD